MADSWPALHELTVDDQHLHWKFEHISADLVTLLVSSRDGASRQARLQVTYIPPLACFDLEYWAAMDLPYVIDDPVQSLKVKMMKTYMQNMRHTIVEAIFAAEERSLLDGSWPMGVARQWLIRTWNNFSHSDFGRAQYILKCQEKQRQPYRQDLTTEREHSEQECNPLDANP